MKQSVRTALPALAIGLCVVLASRVTAQTFTVLHNFAAGDTNGLNSGGIAPETDLLLLGSTLYGTAVGGGSSGYGTVFAVNTDGTGFATLHNFSAGSYGYSPCSELVSSGNTLYGTACDGVDARWAVFMVNTDGSGFGTLDYLAGGMPYPEGGLVSSGNALYGTTPFWPLTGYVEILALQGGGPPVLHVFDTIQGGWGPVATLLLSGGTLYGTTQLGGSGFNGTVFKLNTDGTAFTVLHSFTAFRDTWYTNIDGAGPHCRLIISNGTLYGTTPQGGNSGQGTVFRLNTDGTGFTTLHHFRGGSDGAAPSAGLVLFGSTLYGTAYYGGSSGCGTVFAVNTDGTGFATLHNFSAGSSGCYPTAGLVLSGNTLYGAAGYGGSGSGGAIFSISLPPSPPALTITLSGANVILTWPTNAICFLQRTTNIGSAALWTTNCPAPVVINGQNTATKPVSGTQQFFRLAQ